MGPARVTVFCNNVVACWWHLFERIGVESLLEHMVYCKAREERVIVLDERRVERVNEAGQKFAEALAGSYRAVSGRAASAQQLNAELTQNFFNSVINNLRSQAESNRQMTEELQGQQERQREATQALTQESVGAYMDFVNSMFSYYQGTVEQAGRQAQQAQRQAQR